MVVVVLKVVYPEVLQACVCQVVMVVSCLETVETDCLAVFVLEKVKWRIWTVSRCTEITWCEGITRDVARHVRISWCHVLIRIQARRWCRWCTNSVRCDRYVNKFGRNATIRVPEKDTAPI